MIGLAGGAIVALGIGLLWNGLRNAEMAAELRGVVYALSGIFAVLVGALALAIHFLFMA